MGSAADAGEADDDLAGVGLAVFEQFLHCLPRPDWPLRQKPWADAGGDDVLHILGSLEGRVPIELRMNQQRIGASEDDRIAVGFRFNDFQSSGHRGPARPVHHLQRFAARLSSKRQRRCGPLNRMVRRA